MDFEFATAGRIIFGNGKRTMAADIVRPYGRRALVVTGSTPARAQALCDSLEQSNITVHIVSIHGEPDTGQITLGVTSARHFRPDCVIGFGGGSALDSAKAIAALLTNKDDIFKYLEGIGDAMPMTQAPLPCIAIPTTAGTGSEVTKNAVIRSEKDGVKVSIRHPGMLPCAAIIDPELTLDLPPHITASAGLDAFTQVIEPYVSRRSNPLTDGLCKEGIRLASQALREAFAHAGNRQAREAMCLVSLFGGLALANAGLGAVHGFAGVIGASLAVFLVQKYTSVNWTLYSAIAFTTSVCVGYLVSCLTGGSRKDLTGLTVWALKSPTESDKGSAA